jgi:hypothetical protein
MFSALTDCKLPLHFTLRLTASPIISIAPSTSITQSPRQRDADVESSTTAASATDVEHVPVNDDPRQWGSARKVRHAIHPVTNLTLDLYRRQFCAFCR